MGSPRGGPSRRRVLIAGVVLAGGTIIGVVLALRDDPSSEIVSATSTDEPTALPDDVLAQVTTMVRSYSNEGGPAEVSVRYVEGPASTIYPAVNMSPPVEGTDSRVLVVVAEGDFTMTNAHIPPGAALPTGRYLVVAFSPADLTMVQGVGLGNLPPDLSDVGPVGETTIAMT